MKLKKGDRVVIISGENKHKEGKISHILKDKVVIEGINLVKKHLKPKNNGGNGEIIEIEAPIHKSNVKKIDSKEDKKVEKKETKKEATKKKTNKVTKSSKKDE